MDVIVCIKRVPDTAEADLVITPDEKDIVRDRLVFDVNEWDNYAIEEALLTKEKYGGTVTLVTVGDEESAEALRTGLAKGADTAIRLSDDSFIGSDAYATAKILAQAIKGLSYDFILTGAQAGDDGCGQVGQTLAELLGVPHATLVTKIEIQDGRARVHRELEGGLEEVLEVELPAVFTIQTGINVPRYASLKGIRAAFKKEIRVLGAGDLGLQPDEVGETGSKSRLERLFIPPVEKVAEILQGSPDEVSGQLAEILKGKGLV